MLIETIVLNALIISLWTTALWIATDTNMIFEPVKNWLDKTLSYMNVYIDGHSTKEEIRHYKIYQPLIGCPYCMPSLHGAYLFLFLNWHDLTPVYFMYYIVSFVCATGLNAITISHYNK